MGHTEGIFLGIGVGLVILAVFYYFLFRSKKPDGKIEAKPKEEAKPEVAKEKTPAPKKVSDSERVSKGLSRSKQFLQQTLDSMLGQSQGEQFYEDMEEALLTADVGVDFAEKVVTDLRNEWGLKIPVREQMRSKLSEILVRNLTLANGNGVEQSPRVIMVVGVNGAGKTTTIAKLCSRFVAENKKVLVGAADTFRAAATEQLKRWVEKVGAEGVFQKEGSDPSAVAFDTVSAAQSRKVDVCIIDTAGRLHTKQNLMEELKKMKRVVGKAMPEAPHEVWLVVDGTTGQNALMQAKEFHEALELTGVIVTKLDGSAKGGAVLAVSSEIGVPVVFIGVGESAEDLVPFNGPQFVDALLAGL